MVQKKVQVKRLLIVWRIGDCGGVWQPEYDLSLWHLSEKYSCKAALCPHIYLGGLLEEVGSVNGAPHTIMVHIFSHTLVACKWLNTKEGCPPLEFFGTKV